VLAGVDRPRAEKEVTLDFFGRAHLDELIKASSTPAISIYLPTSRGRSAADLDRLRFKSALKRARDLAEEADVEGSRISSDLLDPLEPLARERGRWNGAHGGLVVFRSPLLNRRYRLPADFPELVVVGQSFHTRPLVRFLQAPDRYWALDLSQGRVRLWGGDVNGLHLVDSDSLPGSLDEALGYEYARDYEVVHRGGPQKGRAGQGGGSTGVFHGHGVGADDREPELRRFFKTVDDALHAFLGPESGPVVLAAVAEHHALYRSTSRLESLAPAGIEASVRDWGAEQLHREAWPIALRAGDAQIDRALELWENSYGRGKTEPGPVNMGPLAMAGRVRLLLIERGRRLWGTVDRSTGRIHVRHDGGDDPGADAVEILDELTEIVLLKGGRSLALPPEKMPTTTGAAAILR
jgi:hypothetical protein